MQSSCMSVYGESEGAIFKPSGSDVSYNVEAIFDREAMVMEPGGEFGVNGFKPMVSFQKTEFDSLGLGPPESTDSVTISGTHYEITETQPDGQSEYSAMLMVASDV